MLWIELVVDVIRLRVGQKRLCQLLFRLIGGCRLGCQVDGAGDPVEGQMKLVELFACLSVAELDGLFLAAALLLARHLI